MSLKNEVAGTAETTLSTFEMHLKITPPDYASIHAMHFDWWMFPINRDSQGEGDKCTVNKQGVASLKNDEKFMNDYLRGVEIVLKAWGWDVKTNKLIENRQDNQTWQGENMSNHYDRLGKILHSLKLFGQEKYFKSVSTYTNDILIKKQKIKIPKWIKKHLNSWR